MKNNDPLMSAFLIFNSEDDPIINATQKRLKAKTATLETDFVLIIKNRLCVNTIELVIET